MESRSSNRPGEESLGRIELLFENQASRTPGAVALLGEGGPITYGELDVRANRVAHRLRRLGVGTGEVVAMATGRTPDRVAGLLGILKAGAAYLPLDPADPPARHAWVLREAGVRMVLADAGSAVRLVLPAGVSSCGFPAVGEADEEPVAAPRSAGQDTDVAYVVFTSGSTGRPKGVAATHRGVTRLFFGGDYVDLGPHRTLAHLAPLTFDAATFEIWGALLRGGRCLLVPETAGTLAAIGAELARHGVDTLWLTSALFNAWVDDGPAELGGIRQLLVGGEALSVPHVRRAQARWPGMTLINGYGPTECTTFACCHRIPRDWPSGATSVPIGKPIAGTGAFVLDEHLHPVRDGDPGELHLAGDGLAVGYINRPELTRERFLEGPFPSVAASRLYRTGDRVRRLPDGTLEFLGRLDDQVKIRGHRIEPGEITAVLNEHPGVRQAAVLAVPLPKPVPGGLTLVAFVVAESGTVEEDGLRRHLAARLPAYLVPDRFHRVPDIPLTPHGKVDREALVELAGRAGPADEPWEPPESELEARLAAILAEVLGLPRVGRHEPFLRLGGESLAAMRVVGRIHRELRRELTLGEFFGHPTVAGLAAFLEGAVAPGEPAGLAGTDDIFGSSPASLGQERLWMLDRTEPGNTAYGVHEAVRWHGRLDVPAFAWSWEWMTRRHEALRTRLVSGEAGLEQVVDEAGPALRILDLRRHRAAEEVVRRHLRWLVGKPFDLERGPLVRTWLYRLGDEEHIWVLSMHHALVDDWSIKVLHQELAEAYHGRTAGIPVELPGAGARYVDHARWQRRWRATAAYETQRQYWRGQLAGVSPSARLPGDRPRSGGLRGRVGRCRIELPDDCVVALRQLAQEESATLFMLVLAALEAWLERHLGRSDFGIGIPVANRAPAAWHQTVGFFVNTLVLPADTGGAPTFRQMLGRVRARVVGAFDHQEMPVEDLVREMNPARNAGGQPLFQVFFNLLQGDGPGPRLPGVETREFPLPEARAMFDLAVYALDEGRRFTLSLAYDEALFRRETMETMAARLGGLLGDLGGAPDVPITRFSLLKHDPPGLGPGADEVPAPPDHRPFPREAVDDSLPGRFRQMVREHGDRVAVRASDGQWTYSELDRETDRIAGEVHRRFGPGGGRIALFFRPGARAIAAILGVLKSGRAYVPLDPGHPPERLKRILRDCQPLALLAGDEDAAMVEDLAWDCTEAMFIGRFPAGEAAPWVPAAVSPEAMAYLLYTSGSTGEPKGVIQSHRHVLHHIRCYSNRLKLSATDRLSLFASYGYDASVMDIFGALLNGAELHLFDVRSTARADLLREISARGITVLHPTPTVLRHLFAGDVDPGWRSAVRVRVLVLGGEPAQRQDVGIHREWFPRDCVLINGLGPTESTLALQQVVGRDFEWGDDPVPVGRPVEGTEVELWNEAGENVELCGEIVLRSEHLALGYWQRPEATRLAFLPPEPGRPGRRYRTGDLGRRRADGSFAFIGRRDFQVKIRGHRVEPGEVARVLEEHPAVSQSHVLAWTPDHGEVRLVAFVVLRRPEDGLEALKDLLRARLPQHMIPAEILPLEHLPLALNGKVDLGALGRLAAEARPAPSEMEAPATPMERMVAEGWREVLGSAPVGRHAHFFESGGHSLLGLRLLAAIQRQAGIRLTFADLLNHPTVSGLAAVCDGIQERESREPTVSARIQPLPRLGRLPVVGSRPGPGDRPASE